jgi:acyl-CoA thioester hydrolase
MTQYRAEAGDPKLASSYKHWESYPLRFKDQDVVHCVNITIIGGLFESGRMEVWRALGHFPFSDESALVPVKTSVEYVRQLYYPDTVKIGTRIEAVDESSVRVRQALFNAKGECCALSETVSGYARSADRTFSPIPDALRKLLESA